MTAALFVALIGMLCSNSHAPAQPYPDRPIRMIVPFAAGGTVDIVARIVGAKVGDITGGRVVIDNRGGAGGILGTEIVSNHVPYKGAGPALADVVAGHVDFTVATMPGAIQQVRAGTLRALGISSLVRSPELPAVPTIAETGVPGYEYLAWFGVFAPGTTPPALVARINALMRQALEASDTRSQLRQQGVEPELLLPDQFRDKVKSEIERWAPVIIKSGMKVAP